MARRAGLLAALALVFATAAAAAPIPRFAVWRPAPQIVFGDKTGGIYVVSPEGGRPRLLVSEGVVMSVSPDGRTLLFGRDGSLNTIPIAGGTPRRVGAGTHGVWSPDGRRIAFVTNEGVFVMDADGRHVRKVATSRYTIEQGPPTWSPDGRKVAYVACSAPYGSSPCEHMSGYDVYVIGVDGSGRHKVTPEPGLPLCPAWSSVAKLAFRASTGQVALVQAEGEPRAFWPGGCPVWAPDGRRLAVPTTTGVTLLNFDGSGRKVITIEPNSLLRFRSVAWSRDGAWLAVVSNRPSRLYVVRADGTGLRRLA
jgi:dipeptidyl aminopeptidase/acylaminoacyl peptidase